MHISRIGSQLSAPIKRSIGMRACVLLGVGAFLFACGTDNGDPVPPDGSAASAPASSTTAGSDAASSSPCGSGTASATPGLGEAVAPAMGEATPGVGTELVGVDGMVGGGGSTTPGTCDSTPEEPRASEGET